MKEQEKIVELDTKKCVLNKPWLAELARRKEKFNEWKWQAVGSIKVLFPQDKRAHCPTIFFAISDTEKVPHYIVEDEPSDIVI